MRFRKPSFKKRIAARTSVKRAIRHSLGVKAPRGMGWFTNPRRAVYNRIYNRTTTGLGIVGYLFGILLIAILFFTQFIIENPWILIIVAGIVLFVVLARNANPRFSELSKVRAGEARDEEWLAKVISFGEKLNAWGYAYVTDINARAKAVNTVDGAEMLKQRVRLYIDELRTFSIELDIYRTELQQLYNEGTLEFEERVSPLNKIDATIIDQFREVDRVLNEIDRHLLEQTK